MLLCPADPTAGVPGVLTEGGSDPTLPCSYLYQFRPDQKTGQEFLLEIEGDMLPIVRLEKLLANYDTTQLQAVGISVDDSAKAIKTLKEKHQLSMPIWVDKNDQIQTLLNRDTSEPQTELITFFLNREFVVKDVFIDFDPENLSQKVNKLLDAKK